MRSLFVISSSPISDSSLRSATMARSCKSSISSSYRFRDKTTRLFLLVVFLVQRSFITAMIHLFCVPYLNRMNWSSGQEYSPPRMEWMCTGTVHGGKEMPVRSEAEALLRHRVLTAVRRAGSQEYDSGEEGSSPHYGATGLAARQPRRLVSLTIQSHQCFALLYPGRGPYQACLNRPLRSNAGG